MFAAKPLLENSFAILLIKNGVVKKKFLQILEFYHQKAGIFPPQVEYISDF
jgi:hypothetical protein